MDKLELNWHGTLHTINLYEWQRVKTKKYHNETNGDYFQHTFSWLPKRFPPIGIRKLKLEEPPTVENSKAIAWLLGANK